MNAPPPTIICLIKSNIARVICWNWSLTFLFANLIKTLNIILIRKNWAGTSHQMADIRVRHARPFLWVVIVHFLTSHSYITRFYRSPSKTHTSALPGNAKNWFVHCPPRHYTGLELCFRYTSAFFRFILIDALQTILILFCTHKISCLIEVF